MEQCRIHLLSAVCTVNCPKKRSQLKLLTRPFGEQLNFARGPQKPVKRDLLNTECFNKWTYSVQTLSKTDKLILIQLDIPSLDDVTAIVRC